MPFENKSLYTHKWAYASRNLVYLQSPLLHLSTTFSCHILLPHSAREGKHLWVDTAPPARLQVSAACFQHWIFILISLYKHFYTWIEPPGFVGRSKLKQKGRKNTMLCSVCGMEKPYWTVITKIDVCHSTEGYIQTIIKTSSVQYKGQYKVQYLTVTTASYLQ